MAAVPFDRAWNQPIPAEEWEQLIKGSETRDVHRKRDSCKLRLPDVLAVIFDVVSVVCFKEALIVQAGRMSVSARIEAEESMRFMGHLHALFTIGRSP
jgi:hypothetical protein